MKTIKLLAERMRNEGVQRAVMVTQASMTPFAKQCLSEMAPKYYIELFQEAELLVNITKHTLVPHHRILTREEKQTLLDRYKACGGGGGGRAGWMGGRAHGCMAARCWGLLLLGCRCLLGPTTSMPLSCRLLLPFAAAVVFSPAPCRLTHARPAAAASPLLCAGQGHAAAAHPVQRPCGPLLWHDTWPGGAHRAALRDSGALRHVQALRVMGPPTPPHPTTSLAAPPTPPRRHLLQGLLLC